VLLRTHSRNCVLIAAALICCFVGARGQSLDDKLETARAVYFEKGPKEALPTLTQLLTEAQKAGDHKHEAIMLGLIGNCYKRLGEYPKSLEYLSKALELKRALKDRLEEGKTLSHLGLLFWEMGEYDKAIAHFQESIAIGR